MRDAEAAERGIVRRGRTPTWVLVKSWRARPTAARGSAPVMQSGYGGPAFRTVVLDRAPEGPPSSILLRPNRSGFVAIARGEPVPEFTVGDKTYGGGEAKADRGFAVTVGLLGDGATLVRLTPVFRGLAEGGADLLLEELAFEQTLDPGSALAIEMSPAAGPVSRSLFGAGREGGEPPAAGTLCIQVEPFR